MQTVIHGKTCCAINIHFVCGVHVCVYAFMCSAVCAVERKLWYLCSSKKHATFDTISADFRGAIRLPVWCASHVVKSSVKSKSSNYNFAAHSAWPGCAASNGKWLKKKNVMCDYRNDEKCPCACNRIQANRLYWWMQLTSNMATSASNYQFQLRSLKCIARNAISNFALFFLFFVHQVNWQCWKDSNWTKWKKKCWHWLAVIDFHVQCLR